MIEMAALIVNLQLIIYDNQLPPQGEKKTKKRQDRIDI